WLVWAHSPMVPRSPHGSGYRLGPCLNPKESPRFRWTLGASEFEQSNRWLVEWRGKALRLRSHLNHVGLRNHDARVRLLHSHEQGLNRRYLRNFRLEQALLVDAYVEGDEYAAGA